MGDKNAATHTCLVPVDEIKAGGVDVAALPDGCVALRVGRVVPETADAVSIALDVPEHHAAQFEYQAGQFLTLLVCVDGHEYRRCYSMSSSPAVGEELRITVKRDRAGVVSNWLNDTITSGDQLHAMAPQGRFVLTDTDRPLIAFAAGSGITPVFSLVRTVLASTTRTAQLFYANRGRDAVIFHDALTSLTEQYGDRLTVHHHLDDERGVVTPGDIDTFLGDAGQAEFYICGPSAFMDVAKATLCAAGVAADRMHIERFALATAAEAEPDIASPVPDEIVIVLDGRTTTARYFPGNTLLQTARMADLRAPSSCETGSCGTCMARLTRGSARMINNDALDEDEVNDGWVLTCQSVPTSGTVRVEYE